MELTLKMFLIVCPLTFLGGFVDSVGGGGGLITLPAFLAAGLPPHFALGTNKLQAVLGTTISTGRFIRTGQADFKLGIPSVIMALIGSNIGTRLALTLDASFLRIFMIVTLPVLAFVIFRRKTLDPTGEMPSFRTQLIIILISSFFIGIYDGFYGPGTGMFLILIYTGLAKLSLLTAEANSKMCNLASGISALIVYMMNGKVLIPLGLAAAVSNMIGAYLGSGMTIKKGSSFVRVIVLIVIALLFVKIISDM